VRVLVILSALILVAGGVGWAVDDQPPQAPRGSGPERPRPAPVAKRPRSRPAVTCAGLTAPCRSVAGRVVYVEAVDPDGDGDAHYVLTDRRSITLPGLTAVDVAPALRPRRLPKVGEWVSAAGPVQGGSHGQQQIHAVRIRHHRGARPGR
jgi:hypothetical protein